MYLTLAEQQKLKHNHRLVTTALSPAQAAAVKERGGMPSTGTAKTAPAGTPRGLFAFSAPTPAPAPAPTTSTKHVSVEKEMKKPEPSKSDPKKAAPAAPAAPALVTVPTGPRDYFASLSNARSAKGPLEAATPAPTHSIAAPAPPAPLPDVQQLVGAMRGNALQIAAGAVGLAILGGLVKSVRSERRRIALLTLIVEYVSRSHMFAFSFFTCVSFPFAPCVFSPAQFLDTKAEVDAGKLDASSFDVQKQLEERKAERRSRQLAKEEKEVRALLRKRFEDYRARLLKEGKPAPPPLDTRALDNLVAQSFEARRRDEEIARLTAGGAGAVVRETRPGVAEWVFNAMKARREGSPVLDIEAAEVVAPRDREAEVKAATAGAGPANPVPSAAPAGSVGVSGIAALNEVEALRSERAASPAASTSGRPHSPRADQEALISTLPYICIIRVLYPSREEGLLTVDLAADDDAPSDMRIVMFEDRDEAQVACLLAQDWYAGQISDARLEAKDPKDARALAGEHGLGVLVVRKGQVPFRPGLGMAEFTDAVLAIASRAATAPFQ